MEVNFKFKVSDEVITPFDEMGIIDVCAVDHSGKCYYVKTKGNSDWHREEQLANREGESNGNKN